jgi:hypothetical protein
MVQLAYNLRPASMQLGVMATSNRGMEVINSRITTTPVRAGYGVFREPNYGAAGSSFGADSGQVWQVPTPAAAADDDAIIATIASSTSIQTLDSAVEVDGATGLTEMFPARKLTLVLSNHADWDATTAVITFYNERGELVSENMSIPNGGNTTLTTSDTSSLFVSLVIPVQSGTGGTATVGVAAIDASITLADFEGVARWEPCRVPYSADYDYGPEVAIPVVRKGVIVVKISGTPAYGDDAYVGTGASNLGVFRNDNTSAVAVTGARFGKVDLTNLIAEVELY